MRDASRSFLVVLAGICAAVVTPDVRAEEHSEPETRALLVELMAGERPHPIGTDENRRVRAAIERKLTESGYAVEVQRRFVCGRFRRMCGEVENVLARREGREPAESVLLNTHYDTQPATPGAGDSMSGVAVALEVARILAAEPPRRRGVVFLFNDGEEAGLLGSTAFVDEHRWAGEIRAVVNLDARGSRGDTLVAATIGADSAIVSAWAKGARRPRGSSLVPAVVGLLPNTNDLAVFSRLGAPGALFGFAEGARSYHSAADTVGRLSPESLAGMGDAALGAVRELADADSIDRDGGTAVFLAIGPWVLRWPSAWSLALLAAGGALVVARAWIWRRRGEVRGVEVAWGLAACLAAALGGGLGALAAEKGRQAILGTGSVLVAHPLPGAAAILLGGAAGAFLGAVALRRRSAKWGQLIAVLVLLFAAGVAAALKMPGSAFLFVLPLVAVGGLAVVGGSMGVALAAAASVALWVAAILQFQALFGLVAPTPLGVLVGLVAGLAAPWLRPERMRWLPSAAAAAGALVALGFVARLPTFSDDQPQFQSLLYSLRTDARDAAWIATGWPVPEAWREHLAFEDDPEAGMPWSRSESVSPAPAPVLELPSATLEMSSSEPVANGRRIRGRLRAGPGTLLLQLVVADGERLRSVSLGGVVVPRDELVRYSIYREGYEVIGLWSPDPEGVELELVVDGEAPLALELVTRTPGLPPEGRALLALRPSWSQPSAFGDSTIVRVRIEI